MKYRDLRDFAAQLERMGELRRVTAPVSPQLEMTALADRGLRAAGPALWFERPTGALDVLIGVHVEVAGSNAAPVAKYEG